MVKSNGLPSLSIRHNDNNTTTTEISNATKKEKIDLICEAIYVILNNEEEMVIRGTMQDMLIQGIKNYKYTEKE